MGNDSDVDLFNPVAQLGDPVFPDAASLEPPFIVQQDLEGSGTSGESTSAPNGQPASFRQGGLTVKELQRQIKGCSEDPSDLDSDLSTPLTSSCEDPPGAQTSALDPGEELLQSTRTTFRKHSVDDEETEGQKILKAEPKHMFILSSAGKPIYTRYSCEDEHLPLFGVMTALVSFVAIEDDELQSVCTRDRTFVFLSRKPLLFVGVSGLSDSFQQLRIQLIYMYNQVISIVSKKVLEGRFHARENYDLRRLLDQSGRKYLDGMCDMMEENPGVLLEAVHCVPLPGSSRDLIGKALVVNVKDLVFNVLIARNQLIHFTRMRSLTLGPADMHIIFNLVSNTGNFKDTEVEHWVPICLPGFDPNGFLHALVAYLDENVCLIMLSVDCTAFPKLKEIKDTIKVKLKKHRCFEMIQDGLLKNRYSVLTTGVKDLRHFVYKQKQVCQYTCPAFSVPYDCPQQQSRLFQLYKQIHQKLHFGKKPCKLVYQSTDSEIILAWLTTSFEMYCCFTPLITKDEVVAQVNKLMYWIKNEESELFLNNAYTF